ncbi:hypothetical protein Ddc_13798 [Ditylenchus destructor]|nr:hypothetical protein Ddc_13798 [Ditylenchus destructor]
MGSHQRVVWRARDGAGSVPGSMWSDILNKVGHDTCVSLINPLISGHGGACTNAKRCMQWREYGSLNEVFEEDRTHGSPAKDLTSSSTVLLVQ